MRASLAAWSRLALKEEGHEPARHHLRMIDELEAVAAGRCDRLMLLMPPGSAKSTYASMLFPPWFLANQPRAQVMAASHTASLATSFGRRVRALLGEHAGPLGLRIDPASRSAGRLGLEGGGGYFATGVRGPLTGRRADLVIVDDPIKSMQEAESARAREHLWDWFRADLLTRLRPGGRVVVVMTRWHRDDLGGRLLESGEKWRVLRLPALAERDDALGRAVGEPLWPDYESVEMLRRKRLAIGDRMFESLFQQSPRAAEGRLFRLKDLAVVDSPLGGARVRAWDLAASPDGGDWTVGLMLARGADGTYQVADIVRLQGGPERVERAILETAARDGIEIPIGLPQDPGQAGRHQVAYFTRLLAGYRVAGSPETGSKILRANPVASQVNGGNVTLLRGGWNRAFLEEVADFPNGAKDDQVDALSRAFAMLLAEKTPARAMRLNITGR